MLEALEDCFAMELFKAVNKFRTIPLKLSDFIEDEHVLRKFI